MEFKYDISIIGGAGHVGFPLGLIFASKKLKVKLIDKNAYNLNLIKRGISPFKEDLASIFLKKYQKNLSYSEDIAEIKNSKFIIVCIGTPITKKLNPDKKDLFNIFKKIKKNILPGQQVIVRSSIYIYAMQEIKKKFQLNNITYCPERIVQGKSLIELPKLPQIV